MTLENPKMIKEGNISHIYSSMYHCIAVTNEREVYGWGSNEVGELFLD